MSKCIENRIFNFAIDSVYQKTYYVLKKLPSNIKYIDSEKRVIITHRNDSFRYPGGELIIVRLQKLSKKRTQVEIHSESMDLAMVTFSLYKNQKNINLFFKRLTLILKNENKS